MKRNTYYFPHDINAHRDPKCAALINDFGFEGYGLFWALIEILHEQDDGKLEKFPKIYEGLAFQLKIDKEKITKLIEAMLKSYNLLHEDEKYIWSNRVSKNLEERRKKYEKKSQAGRMGGLISGQVRKSKQCFEANEAKERKEKEKKGKEKTKALSFDFDSLWLTYPSKDGRKAAERSFRASVKTDADWRDINTALGNYLQSERVKKGYIKNGSTWFANWRDWVTVTPAEARQAVSREDWEKRADKNCVECRGTGKIYVPGTGLITKCWCVK
jgi:hypothetical protein